VFRLSSRLGLVLVATALLLVGWSSSAAASGSQESAGFIVVLDDSVSDPRAVAAEHSTGVVDLELGYVYEDALKGFSANLTAEQLASLAQDPRVDFIEPDGLVTTMTTQTNATWGLDRIDQRNRPLSTTFTYTNTGSGVTAYIIDTGIRFSHSQFGGRAVTGTDTVDGGSADDCNGHGTHVAGTVGGSTYGVAKSVRLVGVRVLSCSGSGTTSGVIAGINWVTGNHASGTPAVANMSLGGGASSALDTAVRNSINDGVSYHVAAGNGNIFGQAVNACNGSPSRVAEAVTVSATNSSDTKASWANFGTCVDYFAPGVSITSAWHTSNTATNTISGTSMATPHSAGVAALYLQTNRTASPATVRNALVANATTGVVASAGSGSPNRLLFTNY
jgi:subtilisin family serine protease